MWSDPGAIVRAVLGEEPRFSLDEVVAESGVSLEQTRRLWRALGFPEADGNVYTAADGKALGALGASIDSGVLDFDLSVAMARALGQTMARLADWEVGAIVHRLEELPSDAERSDRVDLALRVLDDLSVGFESVMVYAWRRHLAAAVSRIVALGGDDALNTTQLTVGFADIVAFTQLSNDLSRQRIGDLVELFELRCSDVVTSQHGRVIKSIGDSVLFVNDDPIRAYDTAEGIINVIGRDHRMPDVRVGLATGAVVMRLGDVFGPPVNMAARLTAVARRNRIIVDSALAALLPEDQFETRRLPARPVRGFGLVEPVAVRRH